jgi:hypothetical protein
METIFPEDTGYKGLFLVGFRKDPDRPTITQRTGTVVLKRTFDLDPVAGELIPSADAHPIFIQDHQDNLVINGDFNSTDDSENLYFWNPEQSVSIEATDDPDSDENYFLRLTGAANGRVVQKLEFGEPLGGRQFWLSFSAMSSNSTTARIENVELESNNQVICTLSADLTNTMDRFHINGTWPPDLQTTEMNVVLRMATNSSQAIIYNNVQVEERSHLTLWDSAATLRYENDIAPFKPEGDLIVLGFTDVPGPCRVKVNGVTWLERSVSLNGAREKAMCGWEPRVNPEHEERRQEKAGGYSSDVDNYPLEWPFTNPVRDPLPGGPGDLRTPRFENIFYNGYLRGASRFTVMPYLTASAQIRLERDNGSNYVFSLPGYAISASYYMYSGSGPDTEATWQSRPVVMNLDTLVVEPENNRCYTVWRGVWPFDENKESDYRKLEVKSLVP